jgi:hypothetical protein
MGDRIDNRKTEAFREAARARAAQQWTPAARAAQADLTREKMRAPGVSHRIADRTRLALADPEVHQRQMVNHRAAMASPHVRERISTATKLGMERWRAERLCALVEAWQRAPAAVRDQFMAGIKPATGDPYLGAQICAGCSPEPLDG